MSEVITKTGPRRLLRDTQTGAYYKGAGEWTADPEQARNFEGINEARELMKYCRLQGAEVVEQSGNGVPDVHIPLEPSPSVANDSSRAALTAAQSGGSESRSLRSRTTGELIEEAERESEAARCELLQAHKTMNALRREMSHLRAALRNQSGKGSNHTFSFAPGPKRGPTCTR